MPSISENVDTEITLKEAVGVLSRTFISGTDSEAQEELHAALVCAISDQISFKTILKHKDRLSVQHYEKFARTTLYPDLISQYQVEDPVLHGIFYCQGHRKGMIVICVVAPVKVL
eukprot:1294969-Ditylum_brightwellii.AAC.1